VEFWKLVEEQDAVMGKRDFAGPRMQPAADEGRHAGGVIRRPERPAIGQRAALDLAGNRGDHRDFEQLRRRQRRQNRRQPRRQHRLAGAGRADHQQIMAAGGDVVLHKPTRYTLRLMGVSNDPRRLEKHC